MTGRPHVVVLALLLAAAGGAPSAVEATTAGTALVDRADGPLGVKANGDSGFFAISGDGRFVAFNTIAFNLDPEAPYSIGDAFVRDLRLNRTLLISRADGEDGARGNLNSSVASISADGRYVSFVSQASNLDPADPIRPPTQWQGYDVYVRDLRTNQTELVSRASGPSGEKANGDSGGGHASADGRYVAFSSGATNLDLSDTHAAPDVFIRDLQTNETRVVTDATDATDFGLWVLAVSADGRYVAYAILSPEFNPLRDELYVRDVQTGRRWLASRADGAGGEVANAPVDLTASLSADGRYVAFSSAASNLDPADHDQMPDVFVRDLQAEETTLVSRAGVAGPKANGASGGGSLSPDGRRVAFASNAWNLDPLDSPASTGADIFVRDLDSGEITLASRTVTGAQGRRGAWGDPQLSADGRYVAFEAGGGLAPGDGDRIHDLYVRDLQAPLPVAGRPPRSAIRVRALGRRLAAGRAWDDHEVQRVELSLTRRWRTPHGPRCEALGQYRAFVPAKVAGSGCGAQFLHSARSTTHWSHRLPRALAGGVYTLTSRAVDTAGRRERRLGPRRGNVWTFRVK